MGIWLRGRRQKKEKKKKEKERNTYNTGTPASRDEDNWIRVNDLANRR